MVALLVIAVFGGLFLWEDRAINMTIDYANTQAVGNVTTTQFANATVALENYGPGSRHLDLSLHYLQYDPRSGRTVAEAYLRTASGLAAFGILLNKKSIQLLYGSQPLGPPQVWTGSNLSLAPIHVPSFTKAVVFLAWNWTGNRSLTTIVTPRAVTEAPWPAYLLSPDWASPDLVPFLSMLGNAAVLPLALLAFGYLLNAWLDRGFRVMSRSYGYLIRFPKAKMKWLPITLSDLPNRPRLLSQAQVVLFGAALTVFKIFYRRAAETKRSEGKIHGYDPPNPKPGDPTWDAPLAEFLKDDATSPGASLFEARTITLIVGFLASIGLSLSWNAGAMASVLLVAGVAYLSWNLGALLFLVREDRASAAAVCVFALGLVGAVAASDVLAILRGLGSP